MEWEIRYFVNEDAYKSKVTDYKEAVSGNRNYVMNWAQNKANHFNFKFFDVELKKIELYNIKKENGDQFILRAYILPSGELQFEGQDFCELAEKMYGDEEYEYYYYFDVESTNKLKFILKTDDLLESLFEFFQGSMINDELRKLCDDNGIKYNIHVI